MRPHARLVALIATLVVSLGLASAARATILHAGEILRVTFTTTPNSTPAPDELSLNLGLTNVIQAHTARTGALYDGNVLLGVGSTTSFGNVVGPLNLDPARSWKSPTSLWNFDNPAIADFTSIVNGTINGRIDFSIATGAMDINFANVRLSMGQAQGPSIVNLSNPQPTVTSVQIVPEPTALALLALLLPVLIPRRRVCAIAIR